MIGQFARRIAVNAILNSPGPIRRLALRWRESRLQRQYAALPLSRVFDQVYDSGVWGSETGSHLFSGEGSTGRYVSEYCQLLRGLVTRYEVGSIADLGCGDFNTGRAICTFVPDYTGVDIAQAVIDANNKAYSAPGIRFLKADLTCDPLPEADAAVMRQVLQHMDNAEIAAALNNAVRTYPLTLITEHLYIGRGAIPNVDMPHGPGTRVPMKSGVFIDHPPFGVKSTLVEDIEYSPAEVLRTWVIEGPSAGSSSGR